jgi:hypothetical protein
MLRVEIWGFRFGFALRFEALLCAMCVRFNLALFPAGGPVLPYLSVHLCFDRSGLKLSAVACCADALADLCGWVWGLSGVGMSRVARVRLRVASALSPFGPHAVRRVPRPSL